jgi:hypothetical protein
VLAPINNAKTTENKKQYIIKGSVNINFINDLKPLLKIINNVKNIKTRLSKAAISWESL